ncbi:MAG: rod shape-determining protein MreC [Spirochaetota bacterium]
MNKFFITQNKNTLALIILIVLCIIMIVFGSNNIVNRNISKGIKVVTIPFIYSFHYIIDNTSYIINSISEINQLKQSLAEAEIKIREYEKQFKQIEEYKKQINILKKYLGLKTVIEENNHYELIACEIVSRSIKSYFESLIIDKGSLDGLEKGMPVIGFQDGRRGVVGMVIEAGLSYSKIRPLHQSGFDIGVRLEKERYVGIVKGKGNINNLELNYIDKRAKLSIGDRVITLGENSLFPSDILVGKISKTFSPDTEFYKKATIEPFININKLYEVFVIKRLPDKEINELKKD